MDTKIGKGFIHRKKVMSFETFLRGSSCSDMHDELVSDSERITESSEDIPRNYEPTSGYGLLRIDPDNVREDNQGDTRHARVIPHVSIYLTKYSRGLNTPPDEIEEAYFRARDDLDCPSRKR